MRSILVLNSKGGSGKTTLATNLAGYYAMNGKTVTLADFDPQSSSMDWLAARPAHRPRIEGIPAFAEKFTAPTSSDVLIMDAPAGAHGKDLSKMMREAETILMPIMPSPIDVRAAIRFVDELKKIKRVNKAKVKMATVANRVNMHTLAGMELNEFLSSFRLPTGKKFPFLAVLRSSQNYVKAADRGLSIFEMAPSATIQDQEQWVPLLLWLRSKRSRP